jgi:hypothetical protein
MWPGGSWRDVCAFQLANCRMLIGASWKGYGGSKSGSGGHSSQQQHTEAADTAAGDAAEATGKRAAGRRAVAFTGDADINPGSRSNRAMRTSLGDDAGSELGTEATGISSCDWCSSLDGSEAASLCMSLDADDGNMFESVSYSRPLVGASSSEATAGGAARSGSGFGSGSGGLLNPEGLRLPGVAAAAAANPQPQQLSPEQYDAQYGPVIRTLSPGESFGELALLQKAVTRTAAVLVTPLVTAEVAPVSATGQLLEPCAEETAGAAAAGPAVGEGGSVAAAGAAAAGAGALLVRVSRSCYDATVRSLQVSRMCTPAGMPWLPASCSVSHYSPTS